MWEPGAYAGMLVMTTLLHLGMTKIKYDKIFFVLLLALLTTLSTTGYIALSFIALLILVNSSIKRKFIYIVIAIPLTIYIYNLEFIKEKIEYQLTRSIDEHGESSVKQGGMSTSRFASFLKDMEDIKKNYIIGVGISDETRYASDKFDKTLRSNGTSDWVVKFGFLGFFVLLINYFYGFKKFFQLYECKGAGIVVLAVIVLSFSEAFLYLPFFLALQFIRFTHYEESDISQNNYSTFKLNQRSIINT
jgi:hypothetical protein